MALPHASSPFFQPARLGNLQAIRALIASGMRPLHAADDSESLAQCALSFSHLECALALIDAGQSLEHLSHISIVSTPASIVPLIERGLDINAHRKNDEPTLLHAAVAAGNESALRILLDAGALPDPLDRKLRTPLTLACKAHHISCAAALLQAGADINTVDHQGATPLIYAAISMKSHQSGDLLKLLLENGADARFKCPSNDYTALMFAQTLRSSEAQSVLIAHETRLAALDERAAIDAAALHATPNSIRRRI